MAAHDLNLSTKEVMQGVTMTVRMPRSFTIRSKVACWLIGLAGRVLGVPCEIEMRDEPDRIAQLFDDINKGLQRGRVLGH